MATYAQRAKLRRMTNLAANDTIYTDDVLDDYIEQYPLMDERGVDPYYYDVSTDPPTQVAVTGWYPTYDLNAAAAAIWEEKASTEAPEFDFPHETGIYSQSTVYKNYMQKARHYASRASAKAGKLIPSPSRNRLGNSYIGNLAEEEP